jgi:hypothetical protein
MLGLLSLVNPHLAYRHDLEWTRSKWAKFCLTHSAALLFDSSACSCVSKTLMVNPTSSPCAGYLVHPSEKLVVSANGCTK